MAIKTIQRRAKSNLRILLVLTALTRVATYRVYGKNYKVFTCRAEDFLSKLSAFNY